MTSLKQKDISQRLIREREERARRLDRAYEMMATQAKLVAKMRMPEKLVARRKTMVMP